MLTRRRKKMNAGDPIHDEDNEDSQMKAKKPREDVGKNSRTNHSSSPSTVTTTSDLMERMSLSNESTKSKPGSPLGTPPMLDYEGIQKVENLDEEEEDQKEDIQNYQGSRKYFSGSYNHLQPGDGIRDHPNGAPILSPMFSPSKVKIESPCTTPPPTLELPPSRQTSSPEDLFSSNFPFELEYSDPGPSRGRPPQLLPSTLSYAGTAKGSSSSDEEKESFDSTARNSWKVLADFGKNIAKTVTSQLTRGLSEPNKRKGRKLKSYRGRNAKKKEESRQIYLQIEDEKKAVREGQMPLLERHCESMKRKRFILGLTRDDIDDIRSTIVDLMQKVVDLPPTPSKKQRSKKVFETTRDFFLRSRRSSLVPKGELNEAVIDETLRE